ncbi:ruby-eye2-like protein [Holotrichia oblita]|uniref:Ruby-eye2-like protein n=1 Tax=Holotrichia oblita TaxID=644536 RepID=A0ACB9TAQ4_HOLOL|nr:ruby-eye2-like protein [Holotrichia oblita]
MSKKEVFVEYLSKINSVIKQSLHQTQRIKFTCFDISSNYIVFGASSGGIYIFNRHPCKFIKLIPNKDGSVTNIVISSEQKDVALSTTKGFIVIVENCFCDGNIQYQIYTQHEGNTVTAMKWYGNDLYSGDSSGQVSVISISHLLKKALFQTPSATLMRLDSTIVQLDIYSNFLLASTKTKTYLCDTLQEQYRQIGKKLRDGHFGACFYNKGGHNVNPTQTEQDKLTRNLKNGNASVINRDVKIYCARPGLRLWEANFDSSVVCTHQFRDSLNVNASTIIHLGENENSGLEISDLSGAVFSSFNFGRIFTFNDYILTFKIDGIYIFDVRSVSLLYWTNYFSDIRDIKILGDTIYIWLENNNLKILSLLDIESFITKILSRKQYLLCAQFCLYFIDDVSELIRDNRLQILKVLNEKLVDKEVFNEIQPLLKMIENSGINSQKLENGIYIVDNVHHRENSITPKNTVLKTSNGDCENIVEVNILNSESNIPVEIDPRADKNYLINILNKQYQFNKINSSFMIPKFQELMEEKDLSELKNMYDLFLEYSINDNDSKIWITTQILKFINLNRMGDLKNLDCDSKLFQFIQDCFTSLNKSDSCKCSFPLSNASLAKIQFYEIGSELIDKSNNFSEICKEVPSMYKYALTKSCRENLISSLPLLIQFNDYNLFTNYCKTFTYDMWDEAIKYFVKLKRNICLNCDQIIKNDLNITWNEFAKCMLHSIGGPSTLKILSRYSKYIPSGELETDFYQSCIFVNSLPNSLNDNKIKYSKFCEDTDKNDTMKNEFDLLILKYLKSKDVGETKRTNSTYLTESNCTICDIPLKSVLFDDNVKLKCGHSSHKICAINKDVCIDCSTRI